VFEFERTMADAEAEERFAADDGEVDPSANGDDRRCPCGHREFLLQAFMAVIDGRLQPVPIDVESLTCPACGREFEAVSLEDGQVVRGEYLGRTELDDD